MKGLVNLVLYYCVYFKDYIMTIIYRSVLLRQKYALWEEMETVSLSDADSSETVSNCSYCYILEVYLAVGLAADQIIIKMYKKKVGTFPSTLLIVPLLCCAFIHN